MEASFAFGFIFAIAASMGLPIPISCPPREPDPVLSHWAPEQCLIYFHSTGTSPLDPQADPTQRWLNQPELKQVADKLLAAIHQSLESTVVDEPTHQKARWKLAHAVAMECFSCPFTVAITRLDFDNGNEMEPLIDGLLMVKLESRTAAVDRLLTEIRGDAEWQQQSLNGHDWWVLSGRLPHHRLAVSRKNDLFLVAYGPDAAANLELPAQPKRPAWLQAIWNDRQQQRLGTVCYLDVEPVARLMGAGNRLPPTELPWMDLQDLRSIVTTTGLDERGFIGRWSLHVDPTESAMSAPASMEAISAKHLSQIPADATGFAATRISPRQIIAAVDSLTLMPMDVEPQPSASERMSELLGVDVDGELLPTLDDLILFYGQFSVVAPTSGWLAAIQIEDTMSFPALYQRMNNQLKAWAEEYGMIYETSVAASRDTIYKLGVPEYLVPTGTICWCLADDYLLFSLDSGTLNKHLRRLRREGGAPIAAMSARQQLYADGENFGLEGPVAVFQLDVATVVALAYPALLMQPRDEPILPGSGLTVQDIPSVEVLTRDIEPLSLAMYRSPGGWEVVHRQTMPSAPPLVMFALNLGYASVAPMEVGQSSLHQSMNNLKQLLIAAHNFEAAHQALPASANVDVDGRPLLSWRVHLLPFLDHQQLYEQFHLDEPWDSPHNRPLVEQMPDVFRHPVLDLEPGKTVYLGVSGPDAILAPATESGRGARGKPIRDIKDGTSNTALLVEANAEQAVYWTQPADFDTAAVGDLLPRLKGNWPSGKVLIGICDGSIWENSELSEPLLRKMITHRGGEVIELWNLPRANPPTTLPPAEIR